ncbi:unnamed protein product, partial [marine sediment metagenome]
MTSLSRPSIRTFVYLAVLFAFLIVVFFLYSFGIVSEGLLGYLLAISLQLSVPLVLAGLGGMFSERGGVVNIGLEGMLLMGAFAAAAVAYYTRNPWLGVLAGMGAGAVLAIAHAIICVKFKGNHIVSGTGVILFGAGFTTLMLQVVWGSKGYGETITNRIPDIEIEAIRDIPVIGTAFSSISPIVILMFVITFLSWYVLFKTPFGLRLRAAGEDPSTLDTAGVNVEWTRAIGVIISGVLAGLGGAYLSIGFGSAFGKEMTGGKGFIALAAMIFGNWNPLGVLIAGWFFGFLEGLQYAIAIHFPVLLPYANFIAMIP